MNDIGKAIFTAVLEGNEQSTITGVENVISNHSKLIEFYSNYAFWLDFFGQFTGKYQKLRMSLGLGYAKPIKKKEKKDLDEGEEEDLAPEARICIDAG